jgi:hypothetical protein
MDRIFLENAKGQIKEVFPLLSEPRSLFPADLTV